MDSLQRALMGRQKKDTSMTWFHVLRRLDRSSVPRAAALWGADPGSVRLAGDGINVVFRFEARGEGRYLRITHAELRSRDALASAIDFLRHLSAAGAPVCRPVASESGRLIEELRQGDELFLASTVAEVPGRCMGLRHTEARVYEAWGRSLGQLHRTAEGYTPAPERHFLSWEDLWRKTGAMIARDDTLLCDEYERVGAWLNALPRGAADFGLTHGDYRPDNVLWDGRQAYTIDFDEPVYHWFAADIARALREFADKPQRRRRQLLTWFVAGYRSVRPLDSRWIADLTWFMRMKDLEIYLWTAQRRRDTLVPGGDDRLAWLANLRRAIWLDGLRKRIASPRPW